MERADSPRDPAQDVAFWALVRDDHDLVETPWEALQRRGWTPTDPATIWDNELAGAIQRLVLDLSWLHVYFTETEHLTDRDLYARLYEFARYSDRTLEPGSSEGGIVVSLLDGAGGGVPDIFFRYYASPELRTAYQRLHPEEVLPELEPAPYPRPWIPAIPEA